ICLSSSLLAFSSPAFFWPRSACERRAFRTFSFDWCLPAISASLLLNCFIFNSVEQRAPQRFVRLRRARIGCRPVRKWLNAGRVVGGRRLGFFLVLLAETAFDELDQGLKRSVRLLALSLDQDRVALAGGKHHQSHDRGAEDSVAFARHPHCGGVARRTA